MKSIVRLIAFYLPQYHSIPENDAWWGKGFTEWTNAKKANPLFKGHYQPHVPHSDTGYYDLSNVAVAKKQAEIAKSFGLYGFCYYYYWFNGKKLLNKPIENMLKSKDIDFPFCICWANENWTRTWDGQEKHVLMPQDHTPEHDEQFIDDVIPVLKDKRYITIDEKPVLVIYRTSLFPDIAKTAALWRKKARAAGLKDLYLVRVEGLEESVEPCTIGFDAAIEFAPDWRMATMPLGDNIDIRKSYNAQMLNVSITNPVVRDYDLTMNRMIARDDPGYKLFRGVFPSWDNTARKGKNGTVFASSSPAKFQHFLTKQIENTINNDKINEEEKLIFINAWNEWGEGCHIEPDQKYGYKYLQAIKDSLSMRYDQVSNTSLTNVYMNKYIDSYISSLVVNHELSNTINDHVARENVLNEENTALKTQLNNIMNSRAWHWLLRIQKVKRLFRH